MRTLTLYLLLLLNSFPFARGWQGPQQLSRRDAVCFGGGLLASTTLLAPADSAQAARGAAELDAEYYLRDLFGGNNPRQGNVLPSTPPTPSPPRVLKEPLVTTLLADDFGPSCVPVAVLVQTVQRARRGDGTRDSEATVVMVREDVRSRADAVRDKARRSFATRAPWRDDSVTDQYYFDLTAYALWKTAADLVPDLDDRDTFVRNVGRAVYRKLVQDELITVPSDTTMADNKNNQRNSIVATVDTVRQVLDVFCQCNFCKSYRLGPDPAPVDPKQRRQSKTKPESEPVIIVDELDDEALAGGGSVDFLVSVSEPATLGAALQITGEQSRFAPDFIGPTLAALWEDTAGLSCTWETYFVDSTYRPNPKDFFPDEQLFQYTLKVLA